jgi:CBS domain-containing protein
MKVKDVMHKGVDWVSPDTPATELAKLMRDHDVGAIPIGENDRLVGMVTDRDIVCKDWHRTISMRAVRQRAM